MGANNNLEFLDLVSSNVNCKVLTFKKGQFIDLPPSKQTVVIVKKGSVSLKRQNEEGNVYLLERFYKSEIFAKMWYKYDENELYFVCDCETEIILIDYSLLIQSCINSYQNISIVNLLFQKICDYTSNLNQKISLLQTKKLESRILKYLAIHQIDNVVELKMNYKDLADYFMVDRSTFMRKLGEMEKSGIIKRSGKTITLL